MPIWDIFSKRQKQLRGEVVDVFVYEDIPQAFRVQVIHILSDAICTVKELGSRNIEEAYQFIKDTLCREYGTFQLANDLWVDKEVFNFLLSEVDHEKVLDVVELSFRIIDKVVRDNPYRFRDFTKISPDEAIEELNQRFLEHGLGYQFEEGKILRIDEEIIHQEATKPALMILAKEMYQGANEEFRSAHDHYKAGEYKECLVNCNKSLESVMKSICEERKWKYEERDTASRLLEICFDNGLIPSYLKSHFNALRSSLESGVPTLRNKLAGHGQGVSKVKVPRYIATYVLNLTASSILLLAEADKYHK